MIMKFISIIFSGLILAFSASAFSAENYYVCDNGDDSNNGRSEETPFRTYEKAMDAFKKMSGGDSINFCRGGTFEITERTWLWNYKCSKDKPCSIKSYGDESLPKPMIVSLGETGFNFQNSGTSKADGGYIIRDLTIISNKSKASGISMFNDVNDLTIENVHIEGFNVGVHAAGANSPEKNSNQANDRITLKNSTIVNNRLQGWLGGCNDCVIENNHFENNGFKGPVLYHNIYIDSPVKSQSFKQSNITVRNNIIKHSTRVNGVCQGASLVVHGIIENLKIIDNELIEDKGKSGAACWGIAIDPGNPLDESFVGLTIKRNTIRNVGGLGIGCASCKDVLIEDNIIIDEADVIRNAIAVPNKPEDSLKSENVTIRNNKIINNHQLGVGILLGGHNRFSATGNDISLSSTDSRAMCIRGLDANLKIDVSQNTCKSHSSVSIIDKTTPVTETPESEISQPEVLPEEPEVSPTPVYARPVLPRTEIVSTDGSAESVTEPSLDNTNDISGGRLTNTTTEDSLTSSTTTSAGSSSSTSSRSSSTSSEPSDLLLQEETQTTTSRVTTLAPTVQESASSIEQSTVSEAAVSESTLSTRNAPTQTRSVTVNEVTNVIENDIPVDESQCRVFARGRCMMQ